MAEIIGVDSLGFLSLDNVKKIANGCTVNGLCSACFDGKYPTAVPEKTEKNRFERKISENKNNAPEGD